MLGNNKYEDFIAIKKELPRKKLIELRKKQITNINIPDESERDEIALNIAEARIKNNLIYSVINLLLLY